MKRILTILAATLLLTAAMAGTASASSYDSIAEELSAIGVFRGTAGGFELDRAPTRSEAAIMLVRLYGAEDEAKAAYEAGEISMPFTDVSETASPGCTAKASPTAPPPPLSAHPVRAAQKCIAPSCCGH